MSGHNQFELLRQRRFAPFFLTQALGAFNDNAFRQALVVMVGFQLGFGHAAVGWYSNLAGALFILPFFLFSASAGQIAEKYEKTRLIRFVKLFEIAAMTLAAFAFYAQSVPLLFTVLVMMGLHSTMFGPIKYAILPQVLHPQELVGGNGLVEMGTSMAVLIGMIAGGWAMSAYGAPVASAVVIGMAIVGYLASRRIPLAPATAPELAFDWNIARATWRSLKFVTQNRTVFNSVLGISWFWFFGFVFTAQLPNYTSDYLGGNGSVETLALALFSIGTGAGAVLCEKLSGRTVEIGLVPFGAIGLTVLGVDLYFARHAPASVHDLDALAFLASRANWHVCADLLLIGLFAGFYIVPLFALVQSRTPREQISRVISGNNILNAVFMVAAAAFGIGMSRLGLSVPELLLATAVLNALVALYIFTLVPEFLMRFLCWIFGRALYRLRVQGIECIPEEGPALLVCNHVSYLDAVLIGGALPRPARFVMYHKIFNTPGAAWMFKAAKAIPIAGAKEDAALMERAFASIDAALADGELVCIFPEGALTKDGDIAPFRGGVERILARRPVPVIPLALRGMWSSMWSKRDSRLHRLRMPRRFRAQIELIAGEAVDGTQANAALLEARVRALRGEMA
ncbi:MAG: MFS transporter [Proteobacteria bacterium]|nr:MFS transporter [Pseudomonadota bacterium]